MKKWIALKLEKESQQLLKRMLLQPFTKNTKLPPDVLVCSDIILIKKIQLI